MNAFDVLLRKADSRTPQQQQQQQGGGKKRRTADPHPATTPAARQYTTCPICQRSLPSSFVRLHTESCLGENPPPASTPAPAPATQPHDQPPPQGDPRSSSGQAHVPFTSSTRALPLPLDDARHSAAAAPGCTPSARLQAPGSDAGCPATTHTLPMQPPTASIDTCETQLPATDSPSGHAVGSPGALARDSHEDGCGDPEPDSQGGGGGGAAQRGKDVFQVLMEGQRRQRPGVHVFFLERTAAGGWRWHWWQKAPRGGEGGGEGEGGGSEPPPRQLPECRWSARTSVSVVRGAGASAATLLLQSNVAPGEGGAVGWAEPGLASNQRVPAEGRWRGAVPALKSALQKNVRLGRGPCAVRCAMQLLKEDAGELLRRLPIICLEDAILHPSLPFLVWVMAAHAKGFVLGAAVCSELLRVTYQMAAGRVRDYLPPANMCPGRLLRSLGEADAGAGAGGPAEAALLKALLLRAAHGGMPGDVAMLRSYAGLWAARFGGRGDAEPPPPPPPGGPAGNRLQQDNPQQRTPSGGAPAGALNLRVGETADRLGDPLCSRTSGAAPASTPAHQQPLNTAGGAHEYGPRQQPTPDPSASPDVRFTPSQHHTPHPCSASGEAYFSFHLGGTAGRDAEPGPSSGPPAAPVHCAGFTPATLLMSAMVREQQALQQALLGSQPQARPSQPSDPGPACTRPAAGRQLQAPAEPDSDNSSSLAEGTGLDQPAVDHPNPEGEAGAVCPSNMTEADAARRPGDQEERQPLTPWLQFMHSVYDMEPPPQLVCAASIGPLRASDVPLSAIDFHVSGVVPQLLGLPPVHAAAARLTSSSWGVEGEPEACLRSAMWLFRSSLNHRRWLHDVYQREAPEQVAYEHVRLLEDLEAEKAQRERLAALWDAAASAADVYSRNFIRRRFQPV